MPGKCIPPSVCGVWRLEFCWHRLGLVKRAPPLRHAPARNGGSSPWLCLLFRAPSIGVAMEKRPHDGQENDFEIERERPVANVIEVAGNTLRNRCVATPSVDLRP